jgi:hypothetical protein
VAHIVASYAPSKTNDANGFQWTGGTDGVPHRQGRAEGLRDQRPVLSSGIGHLHVAVYSNAQLAAQEVELFRRKRTEMFANGV